VAGRNITRGILSPLRATQLGNRGSDPIPRTPPIYVNHLSLAVRQLSASRIYVNKGGKFPALDAHKHRLNHPVLGFTNPKAITVVLDCAGDADDITNIEKNKHVSMGLA